MTPLSGFLTKDNIEYLKKLDCWELLDAVSALVGYWFTYDSFVEAFSINEDDDNSLASSFFEGDENSIVFEIFDETYSEYPFFKLAPGVFKAAKKAVLNKTLRVYKEEDVDSDVGELYCSLIPEIVREDPIYDRYYVACFKPIEVIAWAISEKIVKVDPAFAITPDEEGGYSWVTGREPTTEKALGERAEKTYLNIIGALLSCLTGDFKGEEFSSETELRNFIDEKYDGYYGLRSRTLAEKFSLAKKSINET